MIETHTSHQMAPVAASSGKIQAVFLIETGGTHDLPYFLQWIRLSGVHRGILLLVDISHYSGASLQILREIAHIGIDILHVDADCRIVQADTVRLAKEHCTPHNSFAHPAADFALGLTGANTSKGSMLYISGHHRYDYRKLRMNYKFILLLKKLGIDTLSCSGDNKPTIEGGDCLLVGDHFFVGTRTQERFGGCIAAIRDAYGLSDDLHIHFTGVADPAPSSGLYHLDLYFTYAGMSANQRHQFLVGYIDEQSIGDAVIPNMKAQLEKFREEIIALLDQCYPGGYEWIGVPIIVCDIYRVSPLNGIIDYINGKPTYYFPWPKFINMTDDHPDYNIQDRIITSVEKAYEIISEKLGGNDRVIKFDIPISYTAGSGQALHCTMAVINRDSR